jgi:phosphoglucomutase
MIDVSPVAGKPAPASLLVNVPRLVTAYHAERPDTSVAAERVAYGTSGHRGSLFDRSFNEAHILAITQAICSYRQAHRIDGPLFMGMDTHALPEPAFVSVLEVLAANTVEVMIDPDRGYTPTPVISHAILRYNRAHSGWRTGSSSRPRTTRQKTAASNTTRPTAGRPAPRSPAGSSRPRIPS